MGTVVRINVKGKTGVRSYCYEAPVGEMIARGLRLKRHLERQNGGAYAPVLLFPGTGNVKPAA